MELDESDIRARTQAAGGRVNPGSDHRKDRGSADGAGGRNGRSRGGRSGGPRGANYGGRPGPDPMGREAGDERHRGAAQPDPMKTSLGYIGADSLNRQRRDPAQRARSNGGGGRRGGRGKLG
jgi:23S rRNA pseudouridine2605 synthase